MRSRLDRPPSFEVLAGVLARLDVIPAHLVGISLGGMIAHTLALSRPSWSAH